MGRLTGSRVTEPETQRLLINAEGDLQGAADATPERVGGV